MFGLIDSLCDSLCSMIDPSYESENNEGCNSVESSSISTESNSSTSLSPWMLYCSAPIEAGTENINSMYT
jgi:hypothetical protein